MSRPRVKLAPLDSVQGVDIEIVERSTDSSHVVLPNLIRINGTEVLIPSEATIKIGGISESNLVTVTLTMFVRTLSIRHEPVDPPQT